MNPDNTPKDSLSLQIGKFKAEASGRLAVVLLVGTIVLTKYFGWW